jgi:thioredoxin 1
MSFDEEVERIQRKKLDDLIRRRYAAEVRPQPVSNIPAGVVTLSDMTFTQTTEKYPLTVVDFWAPWCAPCRIISPVIEQLARDYAGRVAFGKLNVDENPLTAATFQVQGIPTIMLFSRGRAVDAIVGAVPKAVIESKIRAHLGGGA